MINLTTILFLLLQGPIWTHGRRVTVWPMQREPLLLAVAVANPHPNEEVELMVCYHFYDNGTPIPRCDTHVLMAVGTNEVTAYTAGESWPTALKDVFKIRARIVRVTEENTFRP